MKTKMIEQVQEQEQIPQELIQKFDGDKELVQEFIKEGYSVSELQGSEIIHPTKFDPIVIIGNHAAGMWLDGGKKYQDNSKKYQNRFS